MILHYSIPKQGNNGLHINSLEDAKPYIKNATYWAITRGDSTSEPENLVAWGGEGGYWNNYIDKDFPTHKNGWKQPSESIIKLILSKKLN